MNNVLEKQPSLPPLQAPNDQIDCNKIKYDDRHNDIVVNSKTQQVSITIIIPTRTNINTNEVIDLTNYNFIYLTTDIVIDLTSDNFIDRINQSQ